MSRSPMRKNILTKVFAIFMVFLMVLPLAGCFDNGSGLKEGFMKSMEVKSSRSISTLSVINNVPSEQLNQQALAVFSLLEKGLAMETAMESLTSMKMVLTLEDGDLLRLMGWTYPQDPSFDLCVDKGKIAMKTSADPRYLVMDPAETGLLAPGANVDFSAAFDAGYAQEQVERVYEFMRPLIKDFDFPLSRVEPLGTVELELPDGTIEARKIKINLDFEEIFALVTYFAEYLAESEAFKDYMLASMSEPMKQMVDSGAFPPEELPSEEEMEELVEAAYQQMQSSLSEAVEYLHTVSPAVLKKQFGLDLSAEEEYYLDKEGFIRKTKSIYQIKAEHEMLEPLLGTPQLDLTINSEQILWDINKPVEAAFPPVDEQVSFFALMGDPALQEEIGDGPLSLLMNLLAAPGRDGAPASLILDLEKNLSLLNGQPIELAPAPYVEGETFMVPFRALAELAGGEIRWIPETRQACYRDDQVEMKFTSGSRQALVNGAEMDLAEAIVIKDGRFMIPAGLAGKLAQHFAIQDGESVVVFIF